MPCAAVACASVDRVPVCAVAVGVAVPTKLGSTVAAGDTVGAFANAVCACDIGRAGSPCKPYASGDTSSPGCIFCDCGAYCPWEGIAGLVTC